MTGFALAMFLLVSTACERSQPGECAPHTAPASPTDRDSSSKSESRNRSAAAPESSRGLESDQALKRDAPPPSGDSEVAHADPDDALLSPTETVRQVREYRLDNRLELLRPYLLPEQQSGVIELIQSTDRLVWANAVLQTAIVKHFGRATARAFDRSGVANAIGVFSRDVDLIDERIDGDRATVAIQIAGRVPLDEVRLVREGDCWLIQTDPPIPGLAKELRNLAQALIDTAQMVDERKMSVDELRRELGAREAAIGRRIEAMTGKP